MKLIKLIIPSLFLSTLAWAQPSGSLVKVKSFVCDRKDKQQKVESGVLIKNALEIFVLTSAHGVFPGKVCYEISNNIREGARAVLLAFNKGNDLAVLRVTDAKGLGGTPLVFQEMPSATSKTKRGILSGFPFDANAKGLQENYDAIVRSFTSNRLMLPFIHNNALEVEGHSEYGLSGGAFWTEDGEFNGLISHQYVEDVSRAGQKPRVRTYDQKVSIKGKVLALVISNEVILPWLQTAFGPHPENANFVPEAELDIQGKFQMNFEGLLFAAVLTGDGAGIGGEDPEERVEGRQEYIEIPITLDSANSGRAWPFRNGRSDLKSIRDLLLARKQVVLTGFRLNGKVFRFTDPMMALYYWNNGYAPELRVIGDLQNDDEAHRKMLAAAGQAAALAANVRKGVPERSDEDFLLAAIQEQLNLILNFQDRLIKDDALAELVEPEANSANARGWVALFNKDTTTSFTSAQELKKILRSIRHDLKEMQ